MNAERPVSTTPAYDFERGEVLLIDKPAGWTSFDVVARLRTLTRCRKIGHAGTLDPLATGLLVICTGAATKRIEGLQATDKDYLAEFKLGYVTASYDGEQPEQAVADPSAVTAAQIESALAPFRGEIRQVPPAYSAVKVAGKRAYKSARAGEAPALEARAVSVHVLTLMHYDPATATGALSMTVSKGTYVRSLVHDLGQALGVGAYLTGLVRTRSGSHRLADALTLEQLAAQLSKPTSPPRAQPTV